MLVDVLEFEDAISKRQCSLLILKRGGTKKRGGGEGGGNNPKGFFPPNLMKEKQSVSYF